MSQTESEGPLRVVATNANNGSVSGGPITQEPKPVSMDMSRSSGDSHAETLNTYEDNASGYQRDLNECTEFCIDLFLCFGACDVCCPLTGEGCLSTAAAFCGGICVGCIKC